MADIDIEWLQTTAQRYNPEAEKQRAELQKRVELNHKKWLKRENKKLTKNNISPF